MTIFPDSGRTALAELHETEACLTRTAPKEQQRLTNYCQKTDEAHYGFTRHSIPALPKKKLNALVRCGDRVVFELGLSVMCVESERNTHLDDLSVWLGGPVLVVVGQHLTQQLDVDTHLFQSVDAFGHFLNPDIVLGEWGLIRCSRLVTHCYKSLICMRNSYIVNAFSRPGKQNNTSVIENY